MSFSDEIKITQLMEICNCSKSDSTKCLQYNNNDLEEAINYFFQNSSNGTLMTNNADNEDLDQNFADEEEEEEQEEEKEESNFIFDQVSEKTPTNHDILYSILQNDNVKTMKYLDRLERLKIIPDIDCLIKAIDQDQMAIVEKICKSGLNLNQSEGFNDTCVVQSVKRQKPEFLQVLLENGADATIASNMDNKTSLQIAFQNEDYECSRIIVKYTKDDLINKKMFLSAVKFEMHDFITLFIKNGYDPFQKNTNGISPFMRIKSQIIKNQVMQYSKGDPYRRWKLDEKESKEKIIQKFEKVSTKSYLEVKQNTIDKIFDYALSGEFDDQIRMLIKNDFPVSQITDSFGNTLLHYCVYYSDIKLAAILLPRSKTYKQKDRSNLTPIYLTKYFGKTKLYILLKIYLIETFSYEKYINSTKDIENQTLPISQLKNTLITNELYGENFIYDFLKSSLYFKYWFEIGENYKVLDEILPGGKCWKQLKVLKLYNSSSSSKMKNKMKEKILLLNKFYVNDFTNYPEFFLKETNPLFKIQNDQKFEKFYGYFYEISRKKKSLVLVTEYFEMPNLRLIISNMNNNRELFDPRIIYYIIHQISVALKDLHEKYNFSHQCLSTDAIKITHDGKIKIGHLYYKGDHDYYNTSGSIFTYNVTKNTNIFSLGVILYELLLGKLYVKNQDLHSNWSSNRNNVNDPHDMVETLKINCTPLDNGSQWQIKVIEELSNTACDLLQIGINGQEITISQVLDNLEKVKSHLPNRQEDLQKIFHLFILSHNNNITNNKENENENNERNVNNVEIEIEKEEEGKEKEKEQNEDQNTFEKKNDNEEREIKKEDENEDQKEIQKEQEKDLKEEEGKGKEKEKEKEQNEDQNNFEKQNEKEKDEEGKENENDKDNKEKIGNVLEEKEIKEEEEEVKDEKKPKIGEQAQVNKIKKEINIETKNFFDKIIGLSIIEMLQSTSSFENISYYIYDMIITLEHYTQVEKCQKYQTKFHNIVSILEQCSWDFEENKFQNPRIEIGEFINLLQSLIE
ncbi:ankyrin repeat domain-containing protein [Anaeramoeba flamelloides]|uniref:Ankyrin repeat domain-containing protein n=1 Tax=Anaeramoeba flamelloides TaxID=1746091 RepID=A0AAV7YRH3_9EUKA|nr:ankyrin repeat domain-containing protein [Anaeramoeba flamelloides]